MNFWRDVMQLFLCALLAEVQAWPAWWSNIHRNGENRALHNQCGRTRYGSVSKRVVGGQQSQDGEWPWLVSLRIINVSTGEFDHLCGGTLIHPKWVVTAAHCFEPFWGRDDLSSNITKWQVRVGEHDMTDEGQGHTDMFPRRIKIHPNRKAPESLEDDLALIELEEAVKLTENVNIICLPSSSDYVAEGSRCVVAGWGHVYENAEQISDIINHVEVTVFSNAYCESLYHQSQYKIDIADTMMCAGHASGGKDACQYDSGGPFVCKKGDQWVAEGLISLGIGCARAEFPGIYTRLPPYLPWIETVIEETEF